MVIAFFLATLLKNKKTSLAFYAKASSVNEGKNGVRQMEDTLKMWRKAQAILTSRRLQLTPDQRSYWLAVKRHCLSQIAFG